MADLSLRWAHRSFSWFCRAQADVSFTIIVHNNLFCQKYLVKLPCVLVFLNFDIVQKIYNIQREGI